MMCPKCNQPSGHLTAEGRCPLCGCDLQAVNRRVLTLYALGLAFFMSVVLYAGLVFFFEVQGLVRKPISGASWLPHVLLLVAVLLFGLSWKMGSRLHTATSSLAVQKLYIVKLALIEAIVVEGLLVYFISSSMTLFVTFLALGLLGFIFAGAQLPALALRIGQLCVQEQEQAQASAAIGE